MAKRSSTSSTRRAASTSSVGLRLGFRSGLEEKVAASLKARGCAATYEPMQIGYMVPARLAKYTPDFYLPNNIWIETKGYFTSADRKKHLLVRECNPKMDLRFVFQNPNNRLRKGSPTTYAAWADKHGFKWAKGDVPDEWISE